MKFWENLIFIIFIMMVCVGIAAVSNLVKADPDKNSEPNICKITAIFEGREIPLIKPDGNRTMIRIPTRICWECSTNEIKCKELQDTELPQEAEGR